VLQFVAACTNTRGLTIPGQSSVPTRPLIFQIASDAVRVRPTCGLPMGLPSSRRVAPRSRDVLAVLVKQPPWMPMESWCADESLHPRSQCFKYHPFNEIYWNMCKDYKALDPSKCYLTLARYRAATRKLFGLVAFEWHKISKIHEIYMISWIYDDSRWNLDLRVLHTPDLRD